MIHVTVRTVLCIYAARNEKCVGCGRCLAVCKDRPCFHVSLICDVSPNCDCHAENAIPIIPDVGMLASFDPVALDQVCAGLCNRMAPIEGSELADNLKKQDGHTCCSHEKQDHFHMVHPDTEWRSCISHAVKIGLGSDKYELVKI